MDLKVMRDVLIDGIYKRMHLNDNIFFLSADFGSPALDRLREDFSDRFINVGIAEQNLINVATGMTLEGYVVYAYAIAPFLTMRAYEQIRNLSLLAQVREINLNLIGVGAGLSYDVTGPTHHCLEDICILNVLPNFVVFSPSDYLSVEEFVDYSLQVKKPKYIRLDGKAQPPIYSDSCKISMTDGFYELKKGKKLVIVSTGYMTHKALKIAELLQQEGMNIGVVDVFLLKPFNKSAFYRTVNNYSHIITMEEGFINKCGLDSIVINILRDCKSSVEVTALGFEDRYVFEVGNRDYLHKVNGLDNESIMRKIKTIIGGSA
jgi:transketolase